MIQKNYSSNGGRCSLSCDNEHILHDKRKTEVTEIRQITVNASDVDFWEELPADALPPYSDHDYDVMVAELIHARYSKDKETALINNMLEDEPTDEHRREYAEYQAFRAECKVRAREILAAGPTINDQGSTIKD